jgi:hypothetical protein
MNTSRNTVIHIRSIVESLCEFSSYALRFLWLLFQPNAVLAARLLAAESQLSMCMRRIEQNQDPRPRFTPGFRLLWVALSKLVVGWERRAHLMQPATVKKWHTTAFRLFWRWKSRRRLGRPPVEKPMQELIRKLSSRP